MTTGILSMASASEALKKWYLPGLQYQLNTASPILSTMDKDSTAVQGLEIVMALRYGRQGGIGMRDDTGTLPTANSRKTKQARWGTKNIFARIQISDKTMKSSRSDRGAFVNLLEAELEDAMVDAKDNLARQVFGNGTGTMATTAVNTAVNTITVSSTQYFAEGQIIDICDTTGATVKYTTREITAVDDTALTITISGGAVTTLVTDIVVISGNYGLELTGFGSVFTADNTLYNVDRSANKWFNPTTIAVGGEISEIILQKGTDETDRKAGGKVNFYSTSYGVRRAYQNLLLATKQIVNVMQLVGGYDALSYNGKPMAVDKYNPTGTIFGLDMSTWKMYELDDWNWLDDDGAVLSRVANTPAWEAVLARYCDLGNNKPKANFKMTGITEH